MSDLHEYTWRCFSGLYRRSRIVFNFETRIVEFHNAIWPNGFFNLFFQKYVSCPFDAITKVECYTQDGTRCVSVDTNVGNCVYVSSDVPRFSELAEDFIDASPSEE